MTKKQFYLVFIEERNGEQEYTFRKTVEATPETIDAEAKEIAKDWYSDEDVEENDGHFEFFGGTLQTKVDGWQEITKEEYKILNKYL